MPVTTAKTPHRSWVTQRLANRLPPWSDARLNRHSVAQQFLNPLAEQLEDLHRQVSDASKNHFLTSANLDMLDIAYVVTLPSGYEFGMDKGNDLDSVYVVPDVTATTQDGVSVTVGLAEDNSIDGFCYEALPDRVEDELCAVTGNMTILAETVLSDLGIATINDLPKDSNGCTVCNRLSVTIAGCENFIDTTRRTPASFLVLTGTTVRDLEEQEVLYINYNGVFYTRKIWKKLDSVEYYGLGPEDSGTVKIELFNFNKGRELDQYALQVDDATEKLLYHRISDKILSGSATTSVHEHLTVTANTLGALYKGEDTLQAVRQIEMGYDSGGTFVPVELYDIALQPFTNWVFGLDSSYLYVFEPWPQYDGFANVKGQTPGATMVVAVDKVDYVRGDTVTFEPQWRRPLQRVYRNRWTITAPDGTSKHYDIDGNEVATGDREAGWIYNKTYTELVFGPFESSTGDISKQQLSHKLTQRGTYLITLETTFIDGTVEKDILPVYAHYQTALARIALPAALQGATGLCFDSEQKLWLLKGSAAHKVHLAYDKMIIDFEHKTLYFRENYSSVVVSQTEDWID